MNEQDVQDILVALLTEDSVQLGERGEEEEGAEPTFEAVSTFEDAGVVSDDKGLMINTKMQLPALSVKTTSMYCAS